MNLAFDGWFRLLRELNGLNRQRFRPSKPTAKSLNRSWESVYRNSRKGATIGYIRAISRKVES